MVSYRVKIFSILLQVLALVITPFLSQAQSATEMKKIFAKAESYYLFGEYELANPLYILLESPENQNIEYKIGVCYLNIPGEKEKSLSYLEEAVKNASYDANDKSFKEKRAPLDAYFFLAKAYMTNNEPEKALFTFETFNKLAGETESKGGMKNVEFVAQQIQACKNAISLRKNPLSFSKRLLGTDFSQGSVNEKPAVSFDGNTLVYTERRGIANVIFFSKKIQGIWQPPIEVTAELKAGEDCSSCSLNSDGTELFLYKTDDYDGAIYYSTYNDSIWAPIKKLNKNINTKFYESHASISSDGKKLYFTSNREGGQGNLDIYVSEIGADGDWGPAKNLGPVINTPFNEDTPFITENDSVLYFSSEGHNSIGGFDNYKAKVLNSEFQAPVNLGFPVNTTDDDNFYQPANNGSNAFYSMITDYKKKDIFYLGFGDIYLDLKGTISLSDTSLVFDENYTIYVTDKTTGDTLKVIHPDAYTGFYNSSIKAGNLSLRYSAPGYFTRQLDTLIISDYPSSELYLDISLLRDTSAKRPEYNKINLSEIPTVEKVDSSMLIDDMHLSDISDRVIKDADVLYYTVQVLALYNPVDVSYFKYISNLKIMYDENDKFFRYTTGVFEAKEDAIKWKEELINKGYPTDLFVKKVSRK